MSGLPPFGLISLQKEANGWFRHKGTATAGRHQREEKKRKIEVSSHKNSNKILSFLGKDVTSQGAEGGLSEAPTCSKRALDRKSVV